MKGQPLLFLTHERELQINLPFLKCFHDLANMNNDVNNDVSKPDYLRDYLRKLEMLLYIAILSSIFLDCASVVEITNFSVPNTQSTCTHHSIIQLSQGSRKHCKETVRPG